MKCTRLNMYGCDVSMVSLVDQTGKWIKTEKFSCWKYFNKGTFGLALSIVCAFHSKHCCWWEDLQSERSALSIWLNDDDDFAEKRSTCTTSQRSILAYSEMFQRRWVAQLTTNMSYYSPVFDNLDSFSYSKSFANQFRIKYFEFFF